MKRMFTFIAMLLSVSTFAQADQASSSVGNTIFNSPLFPFYVAGAFILVVVILVAFVAIYMIRILDILTEQAEKEKAEKKGLTYVPRPSWLSRFSESMNASVPVADEKSIELDHSYDGIRELDNHLPPWWKYLFYITIVWSVFYLVAYHISNSLPLSHEEYQNSVALADEQVRKLRASQPQVEIDENKLVFALDSTGLIANGKKVFIDNNCGSCHRNDGGGNSIGPNLTDEFWLHGGHIKNVFTTIKNGVVDKGMPAWGRSLSPQQVRDVAFFIKSLGGTNPADGRAPQGERYTETAPADSTKVQTSP